MAAPGAFQPLAFIPGAAHGFQHGALMTTSKSSSQTTRAKAGAGSKKRTATAARTRAAYSRGSAASVADAAAPAATGVAEAGAGGERIYGFEPFVPDNARVLILGSMPSVKSLEQGFYYANAQNRMFRLIALYYARSLGIASEDAQPLATVEQRKAALEHLGIAMWDVIASCQRVGSLDSNIKNPVCADIIGLISHYPSITTVITNGGLSARLFERHTLKDPRLQGIELPFTHIALPSTSAANTIKFERLKESYDQALLPVLGI